MARSWPIAIGLFRSFSAALQCLLFTSAVWPHSFWQQQSVSDWTGKNGTSCSLTVSPLPAWCPDCVLHAWSSCVYPPNMTGTSFRLERRSKQRAVTAIASFLLFFVRIFETTEYKTYKSSSKMQLKCKHYVNNNVDYGIKVLPSTWRGNSDGSFTTSVLTARQLG